MKSKKEILIVGAGNIGRGVIGGLFAKADYKLYIYDIMQERMEQLAKQGQYLVERVGADEKERILVKKIQVLDCSDTMDLVQHMEQIDLVACCVYEGAFKNICESLSEAIRKRVKSEKENLNVLLCVNALGAPDYFNKHIKELLKDDVDATKYFEKKVGVCQVMVGMAAMPSTPELLEEDPFAVTTRLGGHIGVDEEAFKGEFPVVESVNMVKKANAQIYRKVYTGNMKHCMTAFLGHAKGYRYISDCFDDEFIEECINGAFYEAEAAIQNEYHFDEEERKSWIDSIIRAKKNKNLKDSLTRVAAKPAAKLERTNRFVGPALMCLKYNILPYYLAKGIAYGFMYRDDEDQESIQITDYVQANGISKAIVKYCSLTEKEWVLKQLIKNQYKEAKKLR